MKRKVLVSLLVIAAVASLVGAGTFAWWSDTERSTNNTFTTGTLGMVISDNNQIDYNGTPVTLSWSSPPGWSPSQEFSGWIELRNNGTTSIPYVEIDWKKPVGAGGTDADALANQIIITKFDERVSGVWYDNIVTDPFQLKVKDFNGNQNELTLLELAKSYKIASEPYGDCTGKKLDAWSACVDHVADSLTGSGYDQVSGHAIPVGTTYRLEMTFKLNPLADDTFQNKSMTMEIVFRGIQDISQRN